MWNHAPRRKDSLSAEQKQLALRNALRYFDPSMHAVLAPEFAEELRKYGRIYMYRFRPTYDMYARPIDHYPARSRKAAAIMMMIQNNLIPQWHSIPTNLLPTAATEPCSRTGRSTASPCSISRKKMTDDQTLVMYSGHPRSVCSPASALRVWW